MLQYAADIPVSSQSALTRRALMWFTPRLLVARDHLCRPEWISGLRRQRQHREHYVSVDFELSTHESLHSIQLSLVHGCAQCSGWRVSSSSVSTAHMSFSSVRCSVTVDSSSFAVSLFLGDVGNPVLLCNRSTSHPRPPVVTASVYRGCPAGTH